MYSDVNNAMFGSHTFLRDLKQLFKLHPQNKLHGFNYQCDPGTDFLKTMVSFSFTVPHKILDNHKSPSHLARDKQRSENFHQKHHSKHSATPSPKPQPTPGQLDGQQGSAVNSKPEFLLSPTATTNRPSSSAISDLEVSQSVPTISSTSTPAIASSTPTGNTSPVSVSTETNISPISTATSQPNQPSNVSNQRDQRRSNSSSLLERAQHSLLVARKPASTASSVKTSNIYDVLNSIGSTDGHASDAKSGVVESTAPSDLPPRVKQHQEVKNREVPSPQHKANNSFVTGTVKTHCELGPRQHNWTSAEWGSGYQTFVNCDATFRFTNRHDSTSSILKCFRRRCNHTNCKDQSLLCAHFGDHVSNWPNRVVTELFYETLFEHQHPDPTFKRLRSV